VTAGAARRLPRSVLARSIASWGYPAAYVVVLLSFTLIWFRHFPFLYIGRDAALSLWLGKAYLDLGAPVRRHGHESPPGHDQHAHGHKSLFQSRSLDIPNRRSADLERGRLVHRLFY